MQQPVVTVEGRRVYIATVYGHPCVPALKGAGAKWDAESKRWWVGTAKRADIEAILAQQSAETEVATEERDETKVYAKVAYKGKNYYVIAEAREKGRCKICLLSGLGFWIDMADTELVKTYQPRTRSYRGHTTTDYTTLGSIRSFVERQKRLEADGVEACPECNVRGPLVLDHEDGCMKCKRCCDMPADE